jgi:hypothetical protein
MTTSFTIEGSTDTYTEKIDVNVHPASPPDFLNIIPSEDVVNKTTKQIVLQLKTGTADYSNDQDALKRIRVYVNTRLQNKIINLSGSEYTFDLTLVKPPG